MRATLLLVAILLLIGKFVQAQDYPVTKSPNERYPERIPDWLWTDPELSGYITPDFRKKIENRIKAADAMSDGDEKDERVIEIATELAKRFSRADLTRDQEVYANKAEGTQLCLRIDPWFSGEQQATIRKAAQLFMEVGTDPAVIQEAFEHSIKEPKPFPAKYELDNKGEPKVDEFGNKIISAPYQFVLSKYTRPASVEQFRQQMKRALGNDGDEPGLLMISYYTGNPWWGGGYIGGYRMPHLRLMRQAPDQGALYIRFSGDKLRAPKPHHDDAAFWAGKIAHEISHNLNYWHPSFADSNARDRDSFGKEKNFIHAYELAVIAAAGRKLTKVTAE